MRASQRETATTATYVNFNYSVSDLTTYTFSNQNLGPGVRKFIIIAVGWIATTARNLVSGTVADIPIFVDDSSTNSTTTRGYSYAWVDGVTATSGNIVLTFSGALTDVTIDWFYVYNIDAPVFPAKRISSGTSQTTTASRTINCKRGELVLFGALRSTTGTLNNPTNTAGSTDSYIVDVNDNLNGYGFVLSHAKITADGNFTCSVSASSGTPAVRASMIVFYIGA